MNPTERRQRYRSYLGREQCIQPASIFDPISSRLATHLGFEIGMFAGSVASGVVLGAPDLTVITLSEFVDQARRITRASDISLMVDSDHGYGNALNVMRTVSELEAAEVCAMSIEDTALPTPFGATSVTVISLEESVGKMKAAVAAKRDPATIVIGRCAAMPVEGIEGVVARAAAYEAAGVDALFFTNLSTKDHVEAVEAATTLPLMLGSAPAELQDAAWLAAHRVRIALKGHLPFQTMIQGIYEALKHHADGGEPAGLSHRVPAADVMAQALANADYDGWQKEFLQ
ncbi:MAG: isocitrate lyase/phosphoenolpyruvate mutase family protein [Chloroflexi bacterium]|nr:isocitrate lyase/phosphoenolpyruvate mutase family protein [Chloroflexota bacterium]